LGWFSRPVLSSTQPSLRGWGRREDTGWREGSQSEQKLAVSHSRNRRGQQTRSATEADGPRLGCTTLPNRNPTLQHTNRSGAVTGTIGEEKEWDYGRGMEPRSMERRIRTGNEDLKCQPCKGRRRQRLCNRTAHACPPVGRVSNPAWPEHGEADETKMVGNSAQPRFLQIANRSCPRVDLNQRPYLFFEISQQTRL